jgi:hypothetical protein
MTDQMAKACVDYEATRKKLATSKDPMVGSLIAGFPKVVSRKPAEHHATDKRRSR